jgi:hypothetical protein
MWLKIRKRHYSAFFQKALDFLSGYFLPAVWKTLFRSLIPVVCADDKEKSNGIFINYKSKYYEARRSESILRAFFIFQSNILKKQYHNSTKQ